jgi:hypothetical protein
MSENEDHYEIGAPFQDRRVAKAFRQSCGRGDGRRSEGHWAMSTRTNS